MAIIIVLLSGFKGRPPLKNLGGRVPPSPASAAYASGVNITPLSYMFPKQLTSHINLTCEGFLNVFSDKILCKILDKISGGGGTTPLFLTPANTHKPEHCSKPRGFMIISKHWPDVF